jgi:hypothetical protein
VPKKRLEDNIQTDLGAEKLEVDGSGSGSCPLLLAAIDSNYAERQCHVLE